TLAGGAPRGNGTPRRKRRQRMEPTSQERPEVSRGRVAATAALAATFAALCLAPHAARLARPSLYADDVARVEQLQVMSPRAMLRRPFNEHLAPSFEVVSLATWHAAGRSLAAAPRTFTIAGLLPMPLILALLGVAVRRESRSTTAALGAVAL